MFQAKFIRRTLAVSCLSVTAGGALFYVYNKQQQVYASQFSPVNEKPALLWQPPMRSEIINRLKGKTNDGKADLSKKEAEFDLLIIGCGATGSGCAVDAAARGLKVACVDRGDFASGTSSRSTKLVHGGVRYLEKAIKQLDYEQFKLVREALYERSTFLKIAPYLANQLPIMIPIYKWYMVPYFWAGSKVYDLVSGMRCLESSYYLSKTKALEVFPMLRKDNLVGAMVYYDGQMNDARVNVALALTAVNLGASVANYVEVVELLKEEEKLCGAVLRDRLTGDKWNVRAKGIINATGPFTDAIRKMDTPGISNIVAPSSGVHIVLPNYFSPRSMGLIDPSTSDGRVIFFLPWEGCTIAGTTDSPSKVTYLPKATDQDVDFIVNEVSDYFNADIKVRRSDILAVWSGIRPLVRDPSAKNTEELVRNHMIHLSESGLLTIAGGKWTTYRSMAQETIDKAIEAFHLKPAKPCSTDNLLLIGSHGYSDSMYLKLIQQHGFETDVAEHLARSYGDRAFSVAANSESVGTRWPFFGKRLVNGHPFIEAEVRYAVHNEFAVKTTDILARRMRLAFLDCQSAFEAMPRVIEIMGEELNWSKERKERERLETVEFLKTMGLGMITPYQAIFSKEELVKYKKEFSQCDIDGDGRISVQDISMLMKRLKKTSDVDLIRKMIEEIDQNKNGFIEFNEFLEIIGNVGESEEKSKFAQFVDENFHHIPAERSGGGV